MAMTHHIITLVVLLLISVSIPEAVSQPISAAAKAYTDAHNKARAVVGVPPLVWSQTLEAAASRVARYQRNQKKCDFASLTGGKYGANQLLGTRLNITPSVVVEDWVKEKPFYDYKSNTCAANHKCGVYTQVVWRDSKELGCAQATCTKESKVLTICFYNPPGNYIGEKPY